MAQPAQAPINIYDGPFEQIGTAIRTIDEKIKNVQDQRSANKKTLIQSLSELKEKITELINGEPWKQLIRARDDLNACRNELENNKGQLSQIQQELENMRTEKNELTQENANLKAQQDKMIERISMIAEDISKNLDKINTLAGDRPNQEVVAEINNISGLIDTIVNNASGIKGGKRRQRKTRKNAKRMQKGGYKYKTSAELEKRSSIISKSSQNNSKSDSNSNSDSNSDSINNNNYKLQTRKSRKHTHKSKK